MRQNKQKDISFSIGQYSQKLERGINLHTYHKKSQFYLVLTRSSAHRGIYVRINYGRGYYNDGVYNTKKEAKEAFAVFTEQALLNYVKK